MQFSKFQRTFLHISDSCEYFGDFRQICAYFLKFKTNYYIFQTILNIFGISGIFFDFEINFLHILDDCAYFEDFFAYF